MELRGKHKSLMEGGHVKCRKKEVVGTGENWDSDECEKEMGDSSAKDNGGAAFKRGERGEGKHVETTNESLFYFYVKDACGMCIVDSGISQ